MDKNLGITISVNARDGRAQLQGVNGDLLQISKTGGLVESAFSRVGTAVSGAILGMKIADMARDLVQTAAETQNLETRLRSLTASAQAYAQEDAYLIDLAQRHHKSLMALGDSYASVLALEKSGLLSRQQGVAITEGLSNATSALGASSAQLHQVMFGLSQALASGTVHAEELNQVVDPLPGLLQAMDKAAGLGAGGLRKLVNDGKVTSAFFRDDLIKALHEYDGAAERTSGNLTAKFTDIDNAYTRLAKTLNQPLTNALTPFLDATAASLDRLTAVIKRARGEGLVMGDVPAELLQRTSTRGQSLGLASTGQTVLPSDARERLRAAGTGGALEILAPQAVESAEDKKAKAAADADRAVAAAKAAHSVEQLTAAYAKQLAVDGKLSESAAQYVAQQKAATDAAGWTASASSKAASEKAKLAEKIGDVIAGYDKEIAALGMSAREAAGYEAVQKLLISVNAEELKQLQEKPALLEAVRAKGQQVYDLQLAQAEVQRRIADFDARQGVGAGLTMSADRAQRELATMRGLQSGGYYGEKLQREMGIQRAMMDARQQYVDTGLNGAGLDSAMADAEKSIRSAEEAQYQLNETLGKTNDLGHEIGMTFSSAFEKAVIGGEDLHGVLTAVIQDIEQIALRTAVTEPAGKYLGNAFSSAFSSIGGLFSGGGSAGGTITGSNVANMSYGSLSPSFFDAGSGAVAFGSGFGGGAMEMPGLPTASRSAARPGAGGSQTIVQVIDQRRGGAAIEQQQSTGPNGEQLIRVIVKDELRQEFLPLLRGAIDGGHADRQLARLGMARR